MAGIGVYKLSDKLGTGEKEKTNEFI